MKKLIEKIAGLTLITTMLGLSGCFWEKEKGIIVYDNLLAEYRSVYATKVTMDNYALTDRKPTTVFLSDRLLQDQLSVLVGTNIYPKKPPADFDDVKVVINNIELNAVDGALPIRLEVSAISEDQNIDVNIDAEAMLVFERYGVMNAGDNSRHAIFGLRVSKIKPGFSWNIFSWKNSGVLADWATVEVAEYLKHEDNAIRIGIPIDIPLSLDASINDEIEVDLNPGLKSKPKATFSIQSKGGELSKKFTLHLPILVDEGIYLVAGNLQEPGEAPLDESASEQELRAAKKELRKAMGQSKSALPDPSSDISLALDMYILQEFVDQYRNLSAKDRKITYNTIDYDKRVHKQDGHYVNLKGKNPISGSVQVLEPYVSWAGSRLEFSANTSVKATVKTHVHLSTGEVGGGIGKDFTIKGKASPSINGSIGFDRIEVDQNHAFVIDTKLKCEQFRLKAEETGELKLGMITWQYIGDRPVAPSTLITDIPVLTLIDPQDLETRDLKIEPAYSAVVHKPTLNALIISDHLALLEIDVTTSPLKSIDRLPDYNDQKLKFIKAIANAPQAAPACPELKDTEFTIKGAKFGPNNEFVKLANNIGKEWEKIKKNPVEAAKDLPGNLKDEIDRLGRKIGDVFGW